MKHAALNAGDTSVKKRFRYELMGAQIGRDLRVRVGVRVRNVMKRSQFDHEKLDVYRKALEFVAWCGRLRSGGRVPGSTATSLDKASTGVALNVAEGNGKFSAKDRCRFITHARIAALKAAATLDILALRQVKCIQEAAEGKSYLIDIVRMLAAWERNLEDR